MLRGRKLSTKDLNSLGLTKIRDELVGPMEGRGVSFMIYDSDDYLRARGSVMFLNGDMGK